MRGRLLHPSEEMRRSLEANIEAAREAEREAAAEAVRKEHARTHRTQVERAASVAISGPRKRIVTNSDITYTSTWFDLPPRHTPDGIPQARLIRHDKIVKRIWGIPVRKFPGYVTAEFRLAATVDKAASDVQTLVLFGKNAISAPSGVYVSPPEGSDIEEPEWCLAEVGGDDWKDVDELLARAEAQLPKLTELVE